MPPGSMVLQGWTAYGGMIGLSTGATRGLTSPDAGNVIELGVRDPPGSLAQTFLTRVGWRYQLKFYAATGRNPSGRVSVGDLDAGFRPSTAYGERYSVMAFEFSATSPLSTLTIHGLGHAGFGPMIDGVSIELIDEP